MFDEFGELIGLPFETTTFQYIHQQHHQHQQSTSVNVDVDDDINIS